MQEKLYKFDKTQFEDELKIKSLYWERLFHRSKNDVNANFKNSYSKINLALLIKKEYKCQLKPCLNNQFKNQCLEEIDSLENIVDAKIYGSLFAY